MFRIENLVARLSICYYQVAQSTCTSIVPVPSEEAPNVSPPTVHMPVPVLSFSEMVRPVPKFTLYPPATAIPESQLTESENVVLPINWNVTTFGVTVLIGTLLCGARSPFALLPT